MGFEEKPVFPPPFIAFSHVYRVGKYLYYKDWQRRQLYSHGLKRWLHGEDLERLHDFEEDCVQGYRRSQELKHTMSTDER